MNETVDNTMTDSQASQFMREKFPPGQRDKEVLNSSNRQGSSRADNEKQHELRRIQFNADMIANNNNRNGDAGVTDVIKALLPKDNKIKMQALMKIRKDPLIAV